MWKPKRFDVLGRRFRIKYVPSELFFGGESLGLAEYHRGLVTIAESANDKFLSPDAVQELIAHEMMHIGLFAGGYDELSNDEAFVSRMSGIFLQMLKSLK